MKKKRKGIRIAVLVIVICLAIGLGGVGFYLYQKVNSGLFFEDTVINGYDVAGKTCKEVLLMLKEDYSSPTLTINEGGESVLTLTLEEAGYTVDQMQLLSNIQECMRAQNLGLIISLFEGNTFEVEVPFAFDETVFSQAVAAANFSKPRTASVDASMEYNGTEYYIQPEVYGNEFDDAQLQELVKEKMDELTSQSRPQEDLQIDVPEEFYYLPAVTQDDHDMNILMDIYNAYCKANITLTFGEVTEVVNWDTVQQWLVIDGAESSISRDSVYNYVTELAAKYDTLYYSRTFTASDGTEVTIPSSDYGYQMDIDGETDQLLADIYSNTTVTREPVYAVSGYKRNGRDDLCGTYVEINLTRQHLWFYIDGELIVESDFVSGLPTAERETATGAFPLAFKESPSVLEGDTWREEVTFWMPFHDRQGLHDAPWRSSFGGNIYQTNGSHGCVNLPYAAAETIYNNIEAGTAILLYK